MIWVVSLFCVACVVVACVGKKHSLLRVAAQTSESSYVMHGDKGVVWEVALRTCTCAQANETTM